MIHVGGMGRSLRAKPLKLKTILQREEKLSQKLAPLIFSVKYSWGKFICAVLEHWFGSC